LDGGTQDPVKEGREGQVGLKSTCPVAMASTTNPVPYTSTPYYKGTQEQAYSSDGYGSPDDDFQAGSTTAPPPLMYPESSQHNNIVHTYPSAGLNDGNAMQGLVEAATSAAALQEQAARASAGVRTSTRRASGVAEPNATAVSTKQTKRKRVPSPIEDVQTGSQPYVSSSHSPQHKHARRESDYPSPSLQIPHDPALDHSTSSASHDSSVPAAVISVASPTQQEPAANASSYPIERAPGVHSAAALFRKPTGRTAKKYTRPPMAHLFMSLQLLPENFLHLQSAAKAYMLDPSHPERQDCVGNRGRGDTDMVKLRLFNCVRAFLEEGCGERFFGEHAPVPGKSESEEVQRSLGVGFDGIGIRDNTKVGNDAESKREFVWPKDATKIITMVTPLMRRMVTNERQRKYAVETRRGGKMEREKEKMDVELRPTPEQMQQQYERDIQQLPTTSFAPTHPNAESIDLSKAKHLQEHDSLPIESQIVPDSRISPTDMVQQHHSTSHASHNHIIQVLIVRNNVLLHPRLDLPIQNRHSRTHDLTWVNLQAFVTDLLSTMDVALENTVNSTNVEEPAEHHTKDATIMHGAALAAQEAAKKALDVDKGNSMASIDENGAKYQDSTSAKASDDETRVVTGGSGCSSNERGLSDVCNIKAFTPSGLVKVESDGEWEVVKEAVTDVVWMEGILKVVVEVA
jgi:hypothetical protein